MVQQFRVGTLYSNEEIYSSLEVGNAGGVRVSTAPNGSVNRLIIMTSLPNARQLAENPYHDRIEGEVLTYTGAGRTGHQNLNGPNARIPQQLVQCFPIYGFILLKSRRDSNQGPKRWAFLGLLQYMRHYPETQRDAAGTERRAWIFEMRICNNAGDISILAETSIMKELLKIQSPASDEQEVVEKHNQDYQNSIEVQTAIETVRAKLLGYDPRKFETFLKALLLFSGFDRVEVTKFTQDGGIDVNAYPGNLSWPIRRLLVQLQAKRWLHTVGRKEVAELRGSLQPHARGCIVTTSHYSRAAIIESEESGKVPISLIDGYELASIVRNLNFVL